MSDVNTAFRSTNSRRLVVATGSDGTNSVVDGTIKWKDRAVTFIGNAGASPFTKAQRRENGEAHRKLYTTASDRSGEAFARRAWDLEGMPKDQGMKDRALSSKHASKVLVRADILRFQVMCANERAADTLLVTTRALDTYTDPERQAIYAVVHETIAHLNEDPDISILDEETLQKSLAEAIETFDTARTATFCQQFPHFTPYLQGEYPGTPKPGSHDFFQNLAKDIARSDPGNAFAALPDEFRATLEKGLILLSKQGPGDASRAQRADARTLFNALRDSIGRLPPGQQMPPEQVQNLTTAVLQELRRLSHRN